MLRVRRPSELSTRLSHVSIRVSLKSMHSGLWAPGRRERARRAHTRRGGATAQGKPSIHAREPRPMCLLSPGAAAHPASERAPGLKCAP